jgi:hypothetical protein
VLDEQVVSVTLDLPRRSRRFRVDIWHRDDGWLYMLVDHSPEWMGPFRSLEGAIDAARARDAELTG